jgi:hypothetical protein
MLSLKRYLTQSAALLLFGSLSVAAQTVDNGQAICHEVQNYVNMLVDYTQTACIPASANGGSLSVAVLSSEPIFSVEASKKPWLLAVVLSLGKAMNDQPSANAGELYVAEASTKEQIAYSLPIAVAKSVQKRVSSGQMQLGAMYKEIEKNLVQKSIQKP